MSRPYPWKEAGFPRPGQMFALGRLLCREREYFQLWKRTGDIQIMERAGFFDDELSSGELEVVMEDVQNPGVWWTPLPDRKAVDEARATGKKMCVLLATGSFAPLHEGHIGMVQASVRTIKAAGKELLGVYLSPSHDSYVFQKDQGRTRSYPAQARIDQIHEQIKELDGQILNVPIMVDPWEALRAPRAVNFTTVVRRLKNYITKYLGSDIDVVYVFGADNEGFSLAWEDNSEETPRTVCVGRPGYQQASTGLNAVLDCPASSSQIRRRNKQSTIPGKCSGMYLIRNEGAWAVSHWESKVPKQDLAMAWGRFSDRVKHILQDAFEGTHKDRPEGFAWVDLEQQRNMVRALASQKTIVALDPCVDDLEGVVAWPQSRLFSVSDRQDRPEKRGVRPGKQYPEILSMAGGVWLLDDDIATGGSMEAAQLALADQGVRVESCISLASHEHRQMYDVVDLRDFLPGAKEAGLVVVAPQGQVVRVPYMAPFTNLRTRARLPEGTSWSTSARLWQTAEEFFRDLPVDLTVEDMWPTSRQALKLMGVEPDETLAQWCAQMIRI